MIAAKGVEIEDMAKFQSIEDMAKDVSQRALREITINDMPLLEFVERINNAAENKECHIASCRHNDINCKCTNEEKRKECVRVSMAVLLIDDLADIEVPNSQLVEKKNPFNVCDANPNCECDPTTCRFAIEYSSFEDVCKGIHKYMCGFDKCKYQK